MSDQFENQEERETFEQKTLFEEVAIKLMDGLPCCVLYPVPCLNKATVIVVRRLSSGVYQFDPPLCRECAQAMAELYKED